VVYRKADGLASDRVHAIASDDRGALWVGTDGGLSRFDEEGLQVLSTKDGLPRNIVTRVSIAPDGSVWFTCPQSDGDILCRYDERSVTRYGREQGLGALTIGGLHVDADGTVWVGAGGNNGRGDWENTSVTGVWRLEENQFTQLDASTGLSDLRVGAIQRAADGRLWIVSANLAKLFDGRSSQAVSITGDAYSARSFPNGDMWVGTLAGAFRWNEGLLTAWSATNGLDSRVLAIAVATNGVTWFGTVKGLFRSENTDSQPVPMIKRGLLSGSIWSLLFDRDGLLWIGTDNGVARFDGAAWSLLGESDGLPGQVVYAIEQAADGAMWFGTDGGLVRHRRNKTTPTKPAVTVRTDRAFAELTKVPSLVQGRWANFRFAAVDAGTPAARRQYRIELKGKAPGVTNLVSHPVRSAVRLASGKAGPLHRLGELRGWRIELLEANARATDRGAAVVSQRLHRGAVGRNGVGLVGLGFHRAFPGHPPQARGGTVAGAAFHRRTQRQAGCGGRRSRARIQKPRTRRSPPRR
jgi:ligand-binding sensor domain-containing protein